MQILLTWFEAGGVKLPQTFFFLTWKVKRLRLRIEVAHESQQSALPKQLRKLLTAQGVFLSAHHECVFCSLQCLHFRFWALTPIFEEPWINLTPQSLQYIEAKLLLNIYFIAHLSRFNDKQRCPLRTESFPSGTVSCAIAIAIIPMGFLSLMKIKCSILV